MVARSQVSLYLAGGCPCHLLAHGDPEQHGGRRGINLRRGTLDDEPATFDVMRRAVGLEMSWNEHLVARRHMRTSPHSSYWLAEETQRFGRTRVVAYAHSMVRDNVWHLTEFFV